VRIINIAGVLWLAVASAQVQVEPLVDFGIESSDPNLSPDGKTLVFESCDASYTCAIYLRPMEGGQPHLFVGSVQDGTPITPVWSPNGLKIAFGRFYSHFDTHLFVRDVNNPVEADLGRVCSFSKSWTADSRFLIAAFYRDENDLNDANCRLIVISAVDGKHIAEIADGNVAEFSPDGKTLAYGEKDSLKIVGIGAEGRPVGPPATVAVEPYSICAVHWISNGRQLLYQTCGDTSYWRRTAASSGAQPGPEFEMSADVSQILPDGTALGTERGGKTGLWRADLQSADVKFEKVDGSRFDDPGVRFSPDGKRVAMVTSRMGHLQISIANLDGSNQRVLVETIPAFQDPDDAGVPVNLEWSPDGKWISFGTAPAHGNADLRSWLYVVPSTGGPLRRLGTEAFALFGASWSHDGQSLLAAESGDILSDNPDTWEGIVRVGLGDGKVARIVRGGIWPHESADGSVIYYFGDRRERGALWRVPGTGGVGERLSDKSEFDWVSATADEKGLLLFRVQHPAKGPGIYTLVHFDPETRKITPLSSTPVPFQPRASALSPDGRFLYVEQIDDPMPRAVRIRGF
jgi:Tol biopolymer transport system component